MRLIAVMVESPVKQPSLATSCLRSCYELIQIALQNLLVIYF